MKIFITGGTGFIGKQLVRALISDGHVVTILTRSLRGARQAFDGYEVDLVEGNPAEPGAWLKSIDGADAVINLCGEKILGKKWTGDFKKQILDSRIKPTDLIVKAISEAHVKPKILINGSAIGYYADRGSDILTEDEPAGKDYAAYLCKAWEETALKASDYGTRVVLLRTGLVLGEKGGALTEMAKPFKFFAGGPIGSGNQYLSWIHIRDHVEITKLCLNNETLSGAINLTAPDPVTNDEFMKTLGKVMGRPSWLRVPAFTLKLMFGEGAALLLEGQRVVPKKAVDSGYSFKFANLEDALRDVL